MGRTNEGNGKSGPIDSTVVEWVKGRKRFRRIVFALFRWKNKHIYQIRSSSIDEDLITIIKGKLTLAEWKEVLHFYRIARILFQKAFDRIQLFRTKPLAARFH